MRQINVGLVGYGLAGSAFHAPLLSASEMWLSAVVTSRVEQVKADLPEVEAVPSLNRLLADPDIELIVVATPTATHFEIARAALEHGKNVVVDKPFTVTVREADTLI
ncbi:MAG: Gfo/Idh/MocA family oxidoreductase, partial [Bryobacteraceae bacterium]|nr:Gfo/Idh/MocA family oxidoreductase [Bryobacteraceae bacterium]